MDTYGLSALEVRALIQRVLLPDICRCDETGDGLFNLTLTSCNDAACQISIGKVRAGSLHSSRAIAELIGEARYLLALEIQASRANPMATAPHSRLAGTRSRYQGK